MKTLKDYSKLVLCTILFFVFHASPVGAQSQITPILSFNGTNGEGPHGTMVLSGKVLYGMTELGGANNAGCIFSIDTNGSGYRDLFDFNASSGGAADPLGSIILVGHKFYGMAEGGANTEGCIFSIDTNGANFMDLIDFNNPGGIVPKGDLSYYNGKVYGMTSQGGLSNEGIVFSMDTNGTGYTDIHDFSGPDGDDPLYNNIIITNGKLFGMTYLGGANSDGCIFTMNADGSGYRVMYSFSGADGGPTSSLLRVNNKFYAMVFNGIFSIDTDGNAYTDVSDFNGSNGSDAYGSLILSPGGVLYGMTSNGGANNNGAIISLDTNNLFNYVLYSFDITNGQNPYGDLTLSAAGTLYGMTDIGGSNGKGCVFKVSSTITSVNEISEPSGALNVYPNPSNGQFTIVAKSEELKGNSVTIYNILGEEVYSQANIENSAFSVNLSSQPNGIYLYRVISETGSLIGEGKITIQK